MGLVDAEEVLDEAGAAIEGPEEEREAAVVRDGTATEQKEQGEDGGSGEQVVQGWCTAWPTAATHGEAVSVLGHT